MPTSENDSANVVAFNLALSSVCSSSSSISLYVEWLKLEFSAVDVCDRLYVPSGLPFTIFISFSAETHPPYHDLPSTSLNGFVVTRSVSSMPSTRHSNIPASALFRLLFGLNEPSL